jgi:hypothetical protein
MASWVSLKIERSDSAGRSTDVPREIVKVTVEWSDGRLYSLEAGTAARLFGGKNPMSSYLAVVFSPDLEGEGWVEEQDGGTNRESGIG